jgi:acyl dehydratase
VPGFVRHTGPAEWARFAAVNNEFVPIHLDDEAARRAGFSEAIGMGRLQWAYLHNMLRDWLDDRGYIIAVSVQMRAPNAKGATLATNGVVTDVRDMGDETEADLDVSVEDQDGVTLAIGTATVSLYNTGA